MFVLSPYHQALAAQAAADRDIATRLALGLLAEHATMTPDDRAEVVASMAAARRRADRIDAQIAWERWHDGEPQVWRPAEPSWSN